MHRWSKLFIPTLREAPSDAEVASHKYLLRAGYVRQLAAGLYSYLFLGQRSILRIIDIVREEMNQIGQEFYLPALTPREVWEASGRWTGMGDNMFRLKDRGGRDLCLGMTHEEIMTDIARKELRSYKQLPQIWYQIQTKFRDEVRPKSGLIRVRQFTMKDSYSFDIDAAGLDVSYQKHHDAYRRIFDRCGLKYVVVEAHSGAMGGSQSHEFMVMTDAGEDLVASCNKCGYAANLDKASSTAPPVQDLPGDARPKEVATPDTRTIEAVSRFLKISPVHTIKTLALMQLENDTKNPGEKRARPVIVLLRGDHTLNEAKLTAALNGREFRPMHPEEIERVFHAPVGFLGPVSLPASGGSDIGSITQRVIMESLPLLLADQALQGRTNLVAGANKADFHLQNITPGRDFHPTEWADLRNVAAGEGCIHCGRPLEVGKAMEIGHIFKLGYKYSGSMGATVLDQEGKEVAPVMGSYGIGMERILTAAMEQGHDDDGFWLPPAIAPFDVVVTITNTNDDHLMKTAEDIATRLERAGYDVLLDDRDERPGVKFKDADLVGIPFRINVGKKVTEGQVEVVSRSTRLSRNANIAAIESEFRQIIQS
ncbi:MAG TPA: proline--tRNA ligase [Candidatus Saccharimonadales bacterium]|jgi:prolyl-tRNA synthetase|nr:proline--tRNA ligase [Candidatus Saccharimonadales bacterium]